MHHEMVEPSVVLKANGVMAMLTPYNPHRSQLVEAQRMAFQSQTGVYNTALLAAFQTFLPHLQHENAKDALKHCVAANLWKRTPNGPRPTAVLQYGALCVLWKAEKKYKKQRTLDQKCRNMWREVRAELGLR